MSDLRALFGKLGELFKDITTTWEQIADASEEIRNLNFVKEAINDPQTHLSTMMELCTTIRGLCEERTTSFEMNDSWEELCKDISSESYLAYIYALAGLANLNPIESPKLSMSAVSTYLLSLVIPGAKGFHIFDEEIIAHCLQVYNLSERLQNPDVIKCLPKHVCVDIWVHLTTLCDDVKILLRYVHFKDYKTIRDNMIKKLVHVLYLNHERGYANAYAANLHTNCFEIFEELINAHNGEPEQTLCKLLNMTIFLHIYPPKPKALTGGIQISSMNCEHISQWFISCIAKYPRLLVKVLSQYIEFVVVNPIKTWKPEQLQRALDYAAKYDAALFTKCNESCLEFLSESVYAEEIMIRTRSIELMARILQIESKVDWQMFRHEISEIPREIHIIKELIDSLRENNNTVKLKAVQGLQMALNKGSPNAQKIITECVRFARFNCINVVLPMEPPLSKNEIRYEKPKAPTAVYTFEGHGLIELSFLHLPENIYEHIFESSVSHLRRAGISFMENLIMLNPLIIFETKFVSKMMQFVKDPTALVRKQAIQTVDALLSRFPCFPLIWIWCKIITPMLHDADPKNIDVAVNCFHSQVLSNIRPLEQSNKAEHFIPWVIIRTMISTESRLYLQVCFNLALKQNLLNSQMLGIIESHLLTSNSLEAWIVLNFISGKIKSKEPDALIHTFLSLPSWNKEPNMLIAIEVLANCISHFSHTALNHAFNHILKSIENGEMFPVLIGKAFDFLILIDRQSAMKSKNPNKMKIVIDWIVELEEHLEKSILNGIKEFPSNRSKLMSHLYSFTEANLRMYKRPNRHIISFVQKYMSKCLGKDLILDSENERFLNSMIIIAGRLSLRDAQVASNTCDFYDRILSSMDHPPIVNTIIIAVTDICKKHTQTVERIIGRVLEKLSSPFAINRLETFKCFEKLVLQDQLKLRDTLLLSLLMKVLDENEELEIRARNFFTEFTTKKNTTLFHKCLTEYPFVLNEYKNFESKDSFSENIIKSPLKGESQRKNRQALYNYFMTDMDEISLILYFNQLKMIAEKCKSDPLMVTTDGFDVIKDIFFILKRVCQLTKEKKSIEHKGGGEEKDEDVLDITDESAATSENKNATGPNASNTVGRTGGRRRHVVTMEDALVILEKSLVYIPAIFKILSSGTLKVEEWFDDLCTALAYRFQNYIKDAQHKEFWTKYQKNDKSAFKNRSALKRKLTVALDEDQDEECDDDVRADKSRKTTANDDYDDDLDDSPLIMAQRKKQPSPSKGLRNPSLSLMEYVFYPNTR